MSPVTSLLRSVVPFLSLPPRLFWKLLVVSVRQLLGKTPTGTWSQNAGETLIICLGTCLPLSFLQSRLQPDPDGLLKSKRYSSLADQLLNHVHQPTFEGYWICRGLKTTPIEPKDADVVIFFMHGGGYALGHPVLEAPNLLFISECLAKHGLTTAVFALRYTLMPEGRFPKQIHEAASAFDWLVNDLDVSPTKIVLMGESAGGHLALSFLLAHHLESKQVKSIATGTTKPASAFLMSPWCDLHNSNAKAINIRSGEADFKLLLTKWGDFVLKDLDNSQRELYLNLAQKNIQRRSWKDILPSYTWISAGDDEAIFVHDIIDLTSAAEDDGAKVDLEIEPGGRHAWQSDSARSDHTVFLNSELGTECEGRMVGFKSLATSIAAAVKMSTSSAKTS